MFKTGSSGIALTITLLALFVFACFSFMGMEYVTHANHRVTISVSVGAIIILGVCLRLACWGKTTRKKYKGRAVEVLSLLVVGVILYLGREPFSQYVYVINHRNEVDSLVSDALHSARNIDSIYIDYADERIDKYQDYLQKNKTNFTQFAKKMRVNSLRRRLLPDSLKIVCKERALWMANLDTVNVWRNVGTPHNLDYLIKASESWVEQYEKVSQIIYQGEESRPFELSTANLYNRYVALTTTHDEQDDRLSNIAMTVCCVLIFSYYIICVRARSRYEGRRA